MLARNFEELTGAAAVTTWVPADSYADLIMEASVCYGQLSGVITAVEHDFTACQGSTIQVRSVPARTAQGPIGTGACLSKTSSTMATYSITVQQYGDYDRMEGFSLFEACGPVKERILNEMAKGLAKKRDEDIWYTLAQYAPNNATNPNINQMADVCSSTATSSDNCCNYKVDLYNSIVSMYKGMQGAALNPDYVIMHPTVAKWLYWKDNGSLPAVQDITPLLKFDGSGQLIKIGPLKVIECCTAGSTCSATSGATMAIVIDSSRAIGEAWGQRPEFHEFYEVTCNWYEETVWMYWGKARLDPAAIGHVQNP